MICSTDSWRWFLTRLFSVRRRLAVQDRLSIQMLREEEEIIDVRPAALAAAVGKKRIGILQIRGTELIDRHRAALFQEETPIRFRFKKFEDRSGCFRTVPVLRL